MIEQIGKTFLSSTAALGLMLWTNMASAMFINVDAVSNNVNNPVTITLKATDTLFLTIAGKAEGGAYDAWSAWDANGNCDQNQPSMCEFGWLWGVSINTNEGVLGGLSVPGIFADPLDALALAKATYSSLPTFPITGFTSYSFYTGEEMFFEDNRGGVSLAYRVVPEEGTVPTPATLALFGIGLAGLGWSRRKKA